MLMRPKRLWSFYKMLEKSVHLRNDVALQKFWLSHAAGPYEFFRIASKSISASDKIVFIRAGIHGEEISGPLTILYRFNEIIEAIHAAGLKTIIYPLGNPSGFAHNQRYNIDGDKGSGGNNDFIRYELDDGTIVDDLVNSTKFKMWHWASRPMLKIKLPTETRLMHALLKNDPLRQFAAAFDLHQDYITPNQHPATYYYASIASRVYQPILDKVAKVIPVLKNTHIGAGYQDGEMQSDDTGCIVRYDGSLTELTHRLGVPHNITIETMGGTRLEKAIEVNMLWLLGILPLCN